MPSERRLSRWRRGGGTSGLAAFRHARAPRGFGAALGAFALLIQVWLPWLHHPPVFQTGEPDGYARSAAFFGDGLALCVRSDSQDRSELPGKAPSHKPFSCPLCRALQMLGSFVPPAGIVVAAGPPAAVVVDAIGQAPIIARTPDPTSQPRAPPLMA